MGQHQRHGTDKASTVTFVNQDDANKVAEREDAKDDGGFFLTGVNVQNQDIEPYSVEDEQPNEVHGETDVMSDNAAELYALEEQKAAEVDKYKMIAVVDSGRTFANNEVSITFMFMVIML